MKVVRSGDLISYCAEEGVRVLGEGRFLTSDSFPGNERNKYCLVSKVSIYLITFTSYYFFFAKDREDGRVFGIVRGEIDTSLITSYGFLMLILHMVNVFQ